MVVRLATLCMLSVCCASAQTARSAAPAPLPIPTVAEAARADIALLEAVCMTRLSDAEKQQVQQYAATEMPGHQQGWAKGYALVQQSMKSLTGKDPYTTGKDPVDGTNIYNRVNVREAWRLTFAQEATNPESEIADRCDPIIVASYGPDHKITGVVTEASLLSLYDTAKWAATRGGLPAPPSGFVARERQLIRQNWNSYSPDLQTAYAHVERNFAASAINMSDIEPEKVRSFIRVSMDPAKVKGGPAAATAGPGALPALMVQAYYNYLVQNHRTLGMSTQEEIMWTHLWSNRIYQTQRDTAHTMLGGSPSAP